MTSTNRVARNGTAAVVALCFVFSSASHAQSTDKLQRARDHFDRGTAFFKQGKYEKALEELMQAYVLDPNPALVYNIARVHEEASDLDNALRFFSNYLTMAPRAKNRRQVRKRIKRLKKAIRRRPKRGFLNVSTDPPGAAVRVNGIMVGTTPVSNAPVKTGRASVTIELQGFQKYQTTVRVHGGVNSTVRAVLKDLPSAVLVYTQPAGAEVTLLTEPPLSLGPSPCLTELPSGIHKLRVEHLGYESKLITFQKKAAETLKVNVRLNALNTRATLMIESNVAGANILVDGIVVGKTPLMVPIEVAAGTVDVEVQAPGYIAWISRVETIAGQPARVSAFLQPGLSPLPATPPLQTNMAVNQGSSSGRKAGWGMLSVGLIGLAAGGTLTLLAHLDAQTADPNNGTFFEVGASTGNPYLVRQDVSRQQVLELKERAEMLELGSIISYSVGGASLLTGIILLAVHPDTSSSDTAMPNVGFSPLNGGGFVRVSVPWQ